ncbi:hypothetical protein B0T11DRAFT_283113 [Plectosphaerella cucumerina]|uniref:Zn(2)-C6 fungal-type domain-containing protein n=1 Tax=Plectosphaerella cucumerina TaxID=40658 RepID=A0A8K0TA10_9PEZI|nr:hypothetical protein B0T11DRAFT_283113 [Plectosphaerella cucumerina]
MDDARYAKRARHACEPCRRKKSKCPGERPVCSYCERLGQECVYQDPTDAVDPKQSKHNQAMENRMSNLEGKLDRLLEHLSNDANENSRLDSSPRQVISPIPSATAGEFGWNVGLETNSPSSSALARKSPNVTEARLLEVGRLYLTWCHDQPITLFSQAAFLQSLPSRTPELVLSLESLSLRFPPGSMTPQTEQLIEAKAVAARRIVMDRITEGRVELSTLQSMCLLSLFDFASGKFSQSRLNLAMLSHLAHDLPFSSSSGEAARERQDCLKSIFVLQQLQGCIERPTRLMGALTGSSIGVDAFSIVASCAGPDLTSFGDAEDRSIASTSTGFCSAWQMARAYAACRVGPNSPPPWDAHSDYSSVMQSHLNIDCRVPLKYRFSHNKIDTFSPEALQKDRHWWMPFLFMQFVYSAIPCLLNHPFLLSMRLRNFRQTIPHTFIQQSFESITRNAGWIIYFIGVLESKGLMVSDPCLAHCVVIVATIHLQHSFVSDPQVRSRAQTGFDKCMRFLRQMAVIWPTVAVMANNLKRLQDSIVLVSTPQDPSDATKPSFSIDSQLLWDLLIYDKAGRTDAGLDRSVLGASEDSDIANRTMQGADDEFNLVGSFGISGHKAVQQENEAYAPSEGEPEPDAADADPVLADMGISFEDMYFEGMGSLGDAGTMFLQATDYGRAIDGWLDIEAQTGP